MRRYRHAGKRRNMVLGPYPALSLKDARDKSRDVDKLLAAGKDPALVRDEAKLRETLIVRLSADNWLTVHHVDWKVKGGRRKSETQFKQLIASVCAPLLPIADITYGHVQRSPSLPNSEETDKLCGCESAQETLS